MHYSFVAYFEIFTLLLDGCYCVVELEYEYQFLFEKIDGFGKNILFKI